MGLVIITTNAIPPDAGCTVPVSCMSTMFQRNGSANEVETAIAIVTGEEPRKCRKIRLTSAPKKFPPMTFRGWAKGLSGALKINTLVAPNGAISNGEFVFTVR